MDLLDFKLGVINEFLININTHFFAVLQKPQPHLVRLFAVSFLIQQGVYRELEAVTVGELG